MHLATTAFCFHPVRSLFILFEDFVNTNKLLTIRGAAERSTLSRRSIQRLVRDGTLPHYRLLGRIRVSENDVDKFVEARFVPARS